MNFANSINRGRLTAALVTLVAGAFMTTSALACTMSNWSSTSGAVAANNPNGSAGDPGGNTANVARYAGTCALQVTGTGHVEDERPAGLNRIIARFYVLPNSLGGTATVYEAFGDEAGGSSQFSVSVATDGTVTATDTATGDFVQASGNASAWNSIEVDWGSGSPGFISLSVNGGAAVEDNNVANSGGTIESVRLGNLNGAAGTLNFDAYESHRSTAVGRLCNCNADGSSDGSVTVGDAIALINEINAVSLASGTPDCTEDGGITVGDTIETINIINGSGVCQ